MEYEHIVERFYQELENGKIMGKKCPRCGKVEFPPKLVCNYCGNLETEWVELSGKATMFDFARSSAITANQELAEYQPYAFACVRLAEGPELNGVVSGVSKENESMLRQKIKEGTPIPVTAKIIQRNGYKSVIYTLD